MSTSPTYATIDDLVTREITPALDEHVDDFDVDAIVEELRDRDAIRWRETGNLTHDGLILDIDTEDFWEVVFRHTTSSAR